MTLTVGQEAAGGGAANILAPEQLLLAGILEHAETVRDVGGIAVVRSTFDRTAKPGEALHWVDGVGLEEYDGREHIVMASHTFIGSGVMTMCGEETCGRAVIDPSLAGEDSIVEGEGTLSSLEGITKVLGRLLNDLKSGNGDPASSYLARVEMARFGLMGHDLHDQSIVLGAARRQILIRVSEFPEYYDGALN